LGLPVYACRRSPRPSGTFRRKARAGNGLDQVQAIRGPINVNYFSLKKIGASPRGYRRGNRLEKRRGKNRKPHHAMAMAVWGGMENAINKILENIFY
jgi:hypothetical protein